MKQKNITLIASERMTSMSNILREDSFIRFPNKVRIELQLDLENNISIGRDNKILKVLKVNRAYVEDAHKFKKIKENNIGFVTNRTHQFINGGKGILWIEKHEATEVITIGADPEFLFMDDEKTARYAADIAYENPYENFSLLSPLGSDGPCGEIRPEPNIKTEKVKDSIRDIIDEYSNKDFLNKYIWKVLAYFKGKINYTTMPIDREVSTGGHVHISLPKYLLDKKLSNEYKYTLYKNITKILDHYIAVPLLRLEDDDVLKRRENCYYGRAGDVRYSDDRFEWRTPSGIWLSDPKYAQGVLSTAQDVAAWAYNNLAPEKGEHTIDALNKIIKEIFPEGELDASAELINNNNPSDISKKEYYKLFKRLKTICSDISISYIEPLFSMQRKEFKKLQKRDLRQIWLE